MTITLTFLISKKLMITILVATTIHYHHPKLHYFREVMIQEGQAGFKALMDSASASQQSPMLPLSPPQQMMDDWKLIASGSFKKIITPNATIPPRKRCYG